MLSLHTGAAWLKLPGAAWLKPATPSLSTRLTVNRAILCRVRSPNRSNFGKARLQPLRRPSLAFRSATSTEVQSDAGTGGASAGTQPTRTAVDDAILIQGKAFVPT